MPTLKQQDAFMVLQFMQRVSVTGAQEAQEYLRCCALLQVIANAPVEEDPNLRNADLPRRPIPMSPVDKGH